MLTSLSAKTAAVIIATALTLSACKTAEERAEDHYNNALRLAEAGDVDRAIIELRNVFQINGAHLEARHKIADLQLNEKSNPQAAYSQYLRLVEQYPDDLKARTILAELAFLARNWDELDRHGALAEELAPEDPQVEIIALARRYRQAAVDEDVAGRRREFELARTKLETTPDSGILRTVLIDQYVVDENYRAALEHLDWMIEDDPARQLYWRQRLSILARQGDDAGIEAHLRAAIKQFPEENESKLTLVRFFMSRSEIDKAEDFLRELADAAPADTPGPRLDLIRFIAEMRDADAALEETNKAIAASENPLPFLVVGAGLDFSEGRRDKAIMTLENVLQDAESSPDTHNTKVTLARMLLTVGNEVGARARVEEVLAEDGEHVQALKMRAAWLIDADETDQAISALRIALDREPEDADAMTLMANAYTRAGRRQLATEFLALAVDASNNAPDETIRYARVLMSNETYLPAEDILIQSLRLNQNDIELLVTLGQLYLRMEDFSRADQIARSLRSLQTREAALAANNLEAELINRQNGPEEALTFLEGIADGEDATLATRVALIRARLGSRDLEGALELARELLSDNPENIALKAVLAATEAVNGNLEDAETLYREILELRPNRANIWLALAQIKARQGDPDAARAVITEALAQSPNNANLLWAQASYLERDGDFDGAIAIYETLYEQNSNAIVIANNLASMLSTYKTDEASLERAWIIARRFRDAEVPAFQDTFGWILHRRGESEEALPYLEAAARSLPGDPIVQYHLGRVYQELGRNEQALAQFRKAVNGAAPADVRPQIVSAQEQIETLQNAQN